MKKYTRTAQNNPIIFTDIQEAIHLKERNIKKIGTVHITLV